jgi:glutaredoxin
LPPQEDLDILAEAAARRRAAAEHNADFRSVIEMEDQPCPSAGYEYNVKDCRAYVSKSQPEYKNLIMLLHPDKNPGCRESSSSLFTGLETQCRTILENLSPGDIQAATQIVPTTQTQIVPATQTQNKVAQEHKKDYQTAQAQIMLANNAKIKMLKDNIQNMESKVSLKLKSVATSQPATSQPATSQPATSQPATSQPATSQPATSQPATITSNMSPDAKRYYNVLDALDKQYAKLMKKIDPYSMTAGDKKTSGDKKTVGDKKTAGDTANEKLNYLAKKYNQIIQRLDNMQDTEQSAVQPQPQERVSTVSTSNQYPFQHLSHPGCRGGENGMTTALAAAALTSLMSQHGRNPPAPHPPHGHHGHHYDDSNSKRLFEELEKIAAEKFKMKQETLKLREKELEVNQLRASNVIEMKSAAAALALEEERLAAKRKMFSDDAETVKKNLFMQNRARQKALETERENLKRAVASREKKILELVSQKEKDLEAMAVKGANNIIHLNRIAEETKSAAEKRAMAKAYADKMLDIRSGDAKMFLKNIRKVKREMFDIFSGGKVPCKCPNSLVEETIIANSKDSDSDMLVYTIDDCSHCSMLKALLQEKGVSYAEYNANDNPFFSMMLRRKGVTFPMVFDIRGENPEFIGGYEETMHYMRK